MSDYDRNTKRRVNGVPAIPTTIDANLQQYLRQLNELLEGSVGIRGNALDRNVTVRELVDAGVAESPEKNSKYVPNAVNAQNRGFVGTGRMRMFTSQRTTSFQSASLTFDHGLGRVPDLVQVSMHCTKTEQTFEPGDIVVAASSTELDNSGNSEGLTTMKTKDQVIVHIGTNGWGSIVEPDNTAAFMGNEDTASNSSWEVEVKAFVFDSATQGN
tara:strand:+ start:4227 stop:4868 length:642 start_codon:yes stop_codon:yes gene_type:complete